MSYKTLEVNFVRPDGQNTTEHFFGKDLDRTIYSLMDYEKDISKLNLIISVNDRHKKINLTTKLSIIARKAEKLTLIFKIKNEPLH